MKKIKMKEKKEREKRERGRLGRLMGRTAIWECSSRERNKGEGGERGRGKSLCRGGGGEKGGKGEIRKKRGRG
ncbi:hypothetical protein [Streptococcus pyogenes]|uniref:hypothetical protein n=1 Tax=Streptococcus pyogenes TaxID=1314 RepID=UPI0011E80434|nr:hypothetical protein [Streptococcus pyogenes]TYL17340.1 hypothetical protein E0F57_09625 [Streptococcus pyogenes]